MSEQARNYYSQIIKVQGMDTDLTVHCDVFGTLLEDFNDEPKLNAQLAKALEWFSNEGYWTPVKYQITLICIRSLLLLLVRAQGEVKF